MRSFFPLYMLHDAGNAWNSEDCNEGNRTVEQGDSWSNTTKTPVEEYWE